MPAFRRGEFDICEWDRRLFEIYKKIRVTEPMVKEIFSEVEIMPGTLELFDVLKSGGVKTAVLSGSLQNAYDVFAEKYGFRADYVKISQKLIFEKDGERRIIGKNEKSFDFEGKIAMFGEIRRESGVLDSQLWAGMGDEGNDAPFIRTVGVPIAVNTQNTELLGLAKIVVVKDLRELIGFLRNA